jgi:DNA-directed RNA polymerase subunit F
VKRNKVLGKIWIEYRSLQIASRNARYYLAEISPQTLQDVRVAFNTIRTYVRGQLGVQ